ncbi:protein CREG1-like [Venturia canescens]|uniref:protein CREG1-like n=1 Tax=Venturia canescens TaxID=32260 RepID=UPI001C9D28BE|nr:protein CREG1-like [Venturia canescens]
MKSRVSLPLGIFLTLAFYGCCNCQPLNYEDARSDVQPPPFYKDAEMARFIVNQADWAALGTISTREDVVGYPIVNVKSISDGPVGNGNGVPYLYITPMGFSAKDLAKDDRASLMMTLAQGPYCKKKDYDPMDPRCPRVILTGKFQKIEESSSEYDVAKSAMFGRHPWLAHMPENHGFFFAKIEIDSVGVLATFGPVHMVSLEDYFNAPVGQQ